MEEDPRAFDAPFFSMSPAEAGVLDAQQRGLLEGAYRTFENGVLPLTWDSLRLTPDGRLTPLQPASQ